MPRLMRESLLDAYRGCRDNPGLLFDRGLDELPAEGNQRGRVLADHLREVCSSPVPDIYVRAYERWERVSDDAQYFARWFGRVDGRLFIGLGLPHVLEAQVTRNRLYGMPMIPGSALKGAARHGARILGLDDEPCEILFGREGEAPEDLAMGYLVFHDAWWVPASAPTPYVPEVVTVHHPRYYATRGAEAATPFDSPNPNHQIAVRGSFLFVIEGPPGWAALGMQALRAALEQDGTGGKAAAGYGFFLEEEDENCARACRQRAENAIRRKEEERLRREQQRAAQEEAARRASLSEEELLIDKLKRLCEDVDGNPTSCQVQKINRAINKLFEEGTRWENADYRDKAAYQIEKAYELIGWHKTGVKRAKREKQRKKKETKIQDLRKGNTNGNAVTD